MHLISKADNQNAVVMLSFLPVLLLCSRAVEGVSMAKVQAGLKVADKVVDIADKSFDVAKKISSAIDGALNAGFDSVKQRPQSLVTADGLAAISKNMKPGTKVTFQNLAGFDETSEWKPAGWTYEVNEHVKDPQPDSEDQKVFAYPMGVGNLMMSGCFGTGYPKGDPCYENIRFIDRCTEQIDAANFIGVGYDITGGYSSESRKKSVVQRTCANKATFLGQHVPDNMNAFGVYDYSTSTRSFQSATKYKEYLAKKSGIKMSRGVFGNEKSEWQRTKSFSILLAGHKSYSQGGSISTESGEKSSTSLNKQSNSQSSSTASRFLAILEADVKLYEIAMDHSSPSDLSATFLEDFSNLPTSYYSIGADIKLQDFVLRYGTHYVKSAKFGGKLTIFKYSSADSKMSQGEFAATAETEFKSMTSTLKSSFQQEEYSVGSFFARTRVRDERNQAKGKKTEYSKDTTNSVESGDQKHSRSEFIETNVEVVGGSPDISAAIMEFYTPAFKNRFIKWLGSIKDYPKPYDMTFGRIPELLDLNLNNLFLEGKPHSGCFGKTDKDDSGKSFFLRNLTSTDHRNQSITITKKVFCDYSSQESFDAKKEEFMADFKARRLALERAISIFISEGPFSTSSFELQAGEKGCETETIEYLDDKIDSSRSWPTAEDIKKKEFKIYFRLPYDIPILKHNREFEVKFRRGFWYTRVPGYHYSIDNKWKTPSDLPKRTNDKIRVTVAGLNLMYDATTGFFKFDNTFYDEKDSYEGNITKSFRNRDIARAEYKNILRVLQEDHVGQVPCNVKWSNSRRIDPTQSDSCVHFSGASNGDIFVIFASIPKDYTTWYYLQISPKGVAFYHAMRYKHKTVKQSTGTLGDDSLFETFFVCVQQGIKRNIKLMYGKAPAQREIGNVHASYEFPHSDGETVSFYTFASGEERVTIGEMRVVKERPQLKCVAEGHVEQNGDCIIECDEECKTCRRPKDHRSCTGHCNNVKHFYKGPERKKFSECLRECPAGYEPTKQKDEQTVCTPCSVGHSKSIAGNKRCTPCGVGNYQEKEGQTQCNQCPVGNKCDSVGLSKPVPCEKNHYNDQTGQESCKPCPGGKKSGEGSQSCDNPCNEGHYLDTTLKKCEPCKENTVAVAKGSDKCIPCSKGEVSNTKRTQCVVNGAWSVWGSWEQCSKSCGTGRRTRRRYCNNPPPRGGKDCPGSTAEPINCKLKECPVNGDWSVWGSWEQCSKSCDTGRKTRRRYCNNPPPRYGGIQCLGVDRTIKSCNTHKCPVYKFDNRVMSWHDAEASCVAWGGHLASIKSPKENELVYKEMNQKGITYLWIGLNDVRKENDWEWVSGESSAYRNWYPGRPRGRRDCNCVFVYNDKVDGRWDDWRCNDRNSFVCER